MSILALAIATAPLAGAQDAAAIAKPACTATFLLECFMPCDDGETLEVIALGLGSGSFSCGNATASCSTSAAFLACTDSATSLQDDSTGICSASLGTQVQCTAGTSFLPELA